jgi:hypothetical protein
MTPICCVFATFEAVITLVTGPLMQSLMDFIIDLEKQDGLEEGCR